jgi:hypothetical protein
LIALKIDITRLKNLMKTTMKNIRWFDQHCVITKKNDIFLSTTLDARWQRFWTKFSRFLKRFSMNVKEWWNLLTRDVDVKCLLKLRRVFSLIMTFFSVINIIKFIFFYFVISFFFFVHIDHVYTQRQNFLHDDRRKDRRRKSFGCRVMSTLFERSNFMLSEKSLSSLRKMCKIETNRSWMRRWFR